MKTEWHSGPPPSIGWWPTSANREFPDKNAIRWWDGKEWSTLANPHLSAKEAAIRAKYKSAYPKKDIRWSKPWWN